MKVGELHVFFLSLASFKLVPFLRVMTDTNTISYWKDGNGEKTMSNCPFVQTSRPRLKIILITVLVHLSPCLCGSVFFSSSSGTLLSSSGGIISSMDVPGGTQRKDGEGGKERKLAVAVPQQQNGGCGEEPVWCFTKGRNVILLSSANRSQEWQLKELKPLWSEHRTHPD